MEISKRKRNNILRALLAKFTDKAGRLRPMRWIQGNWAETKKGEGVGLVLEPKTERDRAENIKACEKASCFCVGGAGVACGYSVEETAVALGFNSAGDMYNWNDYAGRTARQVVDFIRERLAS